MISITVLMGRLTATPELKSTQSGIEVTSFTLAVQRTFKKQGEQRQVDFIDCIAWRHTATFITTYFQKGSMIAVTGSLQTRNYEDKNGNKRKAVELVVQDASFCGSSASSGENYQEFDEIPDFDEDMPF